MKTSELVQLVCDEIDKASKDGAVKPVQLAKLVGVREQMIYRYISDRRIQSFETPGGYKRVKADVAKAWATKYLTRKADRES